MPLLKAGPRKNTRLPISSSRASSPSSKATKLALAWFDLSDPTDRVIGLSLARELKARGFDVLLVGPRRRAEEAASGTDAGFPVFRVGRPRLAAVAALFDASAAWDLLRLHRREKVRLWHCHVFGRSHRAWLWASALGRWRFAATLHLVLGDYLKFAGGAAGLRRLLARAAAVTVVSKANLEELAGLLPEAGRRARVVYSYGSDEEAVPASGRFLPPNSILCPARLAPYKGTDVLIMAFAKLVDSGASAHLVFCGRDQMGGRSQAFARRLGLEDSVSFLGEVPRAELKALMREAACVVLPSRRDNFPIALLEAMSEGAAVAAARVGGVGELVRDGVDGLLVQPEDASALAAALGRLLGDEGLRRRLGEAARRRSRSFGWAAAAEEYARIYESCLV